MQTENPTEDKDSDLNQELKELAMERAVQELQASGYSQGWRLKGNKKLRSANSTLRCICLQSSKCCQPDIVVL